MERGLTHYKLHDCDIPAFCMAITCHYYQCYSTHSFNISVAGLSCSWSPITKGSLSCSDSACLASVLLSSDWKESSIRSIVMLSDQSKCLRASLCCRKSRRDLAGSTLAKREPALWCRRYFFGVYAFRMVMTCCACFRIHPVCFVSSLVQNCVK